MIQKINTHRRLVPIFLIIMIIVCCERKPKEPVEKVLVKIDNKSISINEFIRRAEYTIRPPYCHGSSNLDKKVIINSLIAEKMMSIEATDTNSFITDARMERYIRGLKEQAMRKWLYNNEVTQKIELDKSEIEKRYKYAGYKHQIAYFSIPDSQSARLVKEELDKDPNTFHTISNEITGRDSLLMRDVTWSSGEKDQVLDSLFLRPIKKNEIIGPVKVDENQYLFMKVNHSTFTPAITDTQIKNRYRDVEEVLSSREADKLYDTFVYQVMQGKKLEFDGNTFIKIADLFEPKYTQDPNKKTDYLKNAFYDESTDDWKTNRDLHSQMEAFYHEPFFKIDGEVWTVRDYANELMAHPLVFRSKNVNHKNFKEQMKLAIADMIRDHYLNKVAYERGYDKVNVVERNVNMWRDNINYHHYQTEYLKKTIPDTVTDLTYLQLIDGYLNAKVDSLQKKYSDVIEVNVDAFNDIELTRIDMQATYKGEPFPLVVPFFPLVTTDNTLEYGKKMATYKN